MDWHEERKYKTPETPTDNEIEKKYEGDFSMIASEKFKKIQTLIGVSENEGWYEYANNFGQENITICIGNTRSGKSAIIQTTIGG